jgi:hypothetical protein
VTIWSALSSTRDWKPKGPYFTQVPHYSSDSHPLASPWRTDKPTFRPGLKIAQGFLPEEYQPLFHEGDMAIPAFVERKLRQRR